MRLKIMANPKNVKVTEVSEATATQKKEFTILEYKEKKVSYDKVALLQSIEEYANINACKLIPCDKVLENELQSTIRTESNEVSYKLLSSLAGGLLPHLPPIRAKYIKEHDTYVLLQGHMRTHALKLLGVDKIPVQVVQVKNQEHEISLVLDNMQDSRENSQPVTTFEQVQTAWYLCQDCKNTPDCRKLLKGYGLPRTSADRLGNIAKFPQNFVSQLNSKVSFADLLVIYNNHMAKAKELHGVENVDLLKEGDFEAYVRVAKTPIISAKTAKEVEAITSISEKTREEIGNILHAEDAPSVLKAVDKIVKNEMRNNFDAVINSKNKKLIEAEILGLQKLLEQLQDVLAELDK